MSKNFLAFRKLNLFNKRRFKPGEYVVVAGGKLFRRGQKLEKFLAEARAKYPKEAPLVAKVPQRGTFVFLSYTHLKTEWSDLVGVFPAHNNSAEGQR